MDSVKGLLNIGGLIMAIPTAWCFIEVFHQSSYLLTLKDHIVPDKVVEEPEAATTTADGLKEVVE